MNRILVFIENQGERSKYIIETLLSEFQGFAIEFTEEKEAFLTSFLPKFTYLQKGIDGIPNIFNSHCIENDCIYNTHIPDHTQFEIKKIHSDNDIFSLSFFMLTRTEEYNSPTRDKHGRFPAEASLAFKMGLLHLPVVDLLSEALVQWLKNYFPQLSPKPKQHKSILTFDIDIAYQFLGKPVVRQAGGIARDILLLNFNKVAERIAILKRKKPDPYDVYDFLELLSQQTGIPMIFFFQVRSSGRYDKAVDPKSKDFIRLVKRIHEFADIGIHPSYSGGQNSLSIISEKEILENITGKRIKHSRQHFLKLHFPATPRTLVKAGIENDYTMGYADFPGWRAGTCKPFRVFDLQNNEILPLTTYPISVMDGTLGEYLKLNPQEALLKIEEIFKTIQIYNGTFIPLWHNTTLSEAGKWKNWRKDVFEPMTERIKQHNQ